MVEDMDLRKLGQKVARGMIADYVKTIRDADPMRIRAYMERECSEEEYEAAVGSLRDENDVRFLDGFADVVEGEWS